MTILHTAPLQIRIIGPILTSFGIAGRADPWRADSLRCYIRHHKNILSFSTPLILDDFLKSVYAAFDNICRDSDSPR
jgi:hypothetical protein